MEYRETTTNEVEYGIHCPRRGVAMKSGMRSSYAIPAFADMSEQHGGSWTGSDAPQALMTGFPISERRRATLAKALLRRSTNYGEMQGRFWL
jgi:hypothetical protein